MVQKSLVSYVKRMLKKGYNMNSIKAKLIEYGYPKQIIDETISYLSTPKIKHEIHLSRSALIGIGILVLGLVIVALALMIGSEKAPKRLLDLSVDVLTNNVEKGGLVEFNINLISFGAVKRYDVKLNYNIVDMNNKIISFKTETAALETRASIKASMEVPDDISTGNYMIKVIANYNGNKATASDGFLVSEKGIEEPVEEKKPIEEDKPEEKIPKEKPIEEPKKEPKPLEPTIPDLEKARELAESNPKKAVDYCNQLIDKDNCYIEVAKITKEPEYCDNIKEESKKDGCYSIIAEFVFDSSICSNIVSDSKRDICYTYFVTEGDYTVCSELTLDYLRDSCNQLKMLEELKNK